MPKLKTELQYKPPEEEIIDAEVTSLVPYSPDQTAIAPADMQLAQVLQASGFWSDTRGQAQVLAKVWAGRELGLGPVAAMGGLLLIKGRISLTSNVMAALIKRSRRYNYKVTKLTNEECSILFTDSGEECGTSTFTMNDAKLAGIAGGDNWRKYPRNMLFARAISNGFRWFCPDLSGQPAYMPDELDAPTPLDDLHLLPSEIIEG